MLGTHLRHASSSHQHWTLRAAVLALTLLPLLLSACGTGNVSSNTPNSTATVQIGHDGTLLPGVFKWGADTTGGMPYIVPKDSNNPKADYYGFEVDIATAMAQLMGIQEQPTQITWSNWPQGLASQQFDFFMNGLEITPDNLKSAKFSIPYYVYTQSIVVLSTNTSIHTFNDLAGKTVETGTGYEAESVMEDYNSKNPNTKINIKLTDTPTPFTDLQSGRVDAMFIDTPIAAWYGANDPSGKFKIVGDPMDAGYYAIGFSPNNPNADKLIGEINKAIEVMWNNGTLRKIYESGGAYNAASNSQPVFEKYGMWNNTQACIGNFLPDNPTHVSGCPDLPTASK